MKKFLASLLLSACALSGLAQAGMVDDVVQRGTLRVGMDPTYMPFEMTNKRGEIIGFEVDLLKAMAKAMGVKLELVSTGYDGIIPALLTDKFDMIGSGMTLTQERNLRVNFSDPFIVVGQTLLIRQELQGKIKSYKDLNDAQYRITSKVGTYHDVTLKQANGEWEIVTDSYDEGPEFTQSPDYVAPKAAAPAPYQTSLDLPQASVAPEELYNFTYDHQAAANYSNAYWSSYNLAYKNFNPVGGDCANFVSQSLRAGGQPDDGSWYYRNAGGSTADDGWTYAWVNNQGLRDWARNTMRGIAYTNYAQLMVGDFINYDWNWDGTYDHVTIVVQAGTNALINSHNSDRYHYPYNYGSSQGMQYTHLYTWP